MYFYLQTGFAGEIHETGQHPAQLFLPDAARMQRVHISFDLVRIDDPPPAAGHF